MTSVGRCIAFDIDDTLYLERDYVESGFTAVSDWLYVKRGIVGFRDAALAEFRRGVRGNTFDRALECLGVEREANLLQEMVRVYRSHTPSICLLPDAKKAIILLNEHFKLSVISDGPAASQCAKATALGLGAWCNPIVLTDLLGTEFDKPHTKGFEIVQESTRCRGRHCVYVADNPGKDFAGPKRLGWRTVRVRRVSGVYAAIQSGSDVDVELADLSSLHVTVEGF
jgi:putative hydrolase of the HAD superfamily